MKKSDRRAWLIQRSDSSKGRAQNEESAKGRGVARHLTTFLVTSVVPMKICSSTSLKHICYQTHGINN